jgi:hypothetical protein
MAEIEAARCVPSVPMSIEQMRVEMAEAYLHDGEFDAAHWVLLGEDDEEVREYLTGD